MKTHLIHYLSLIYFVKHPLHVSGVFIVHHQEVFTVLYIYGNFDGIHPDYNIYKYCTILRPTQPNSLLLTFIYTFYSALVTFISV
jgi:hypothetical protein